MRVFSRSDGRYYAIGRPCCDLFGHEVVLVFHGSVHSRLGGTQTRQPDEVPRLIKARLAHGYVEQVMTPGSD